MSDSENEKMDDGEIRQTRQQSLHAKWAEAGYVSNNLPMPSPDEHDEVDDNGKLIHLSGDATKPRRLGDDESTEQIIAHVVDDSGSFGRGGMFTAINKNFPSVAERYEKIAEMKDMKVGDVHLIDVTDNLNTSTSEDNEKENKQGPEKGKKPKTMVALLIAQHADKRDEIQTEFLKTCLKKVAHYALTARHKVSVHFAKLGTGMDAFEKLAEKHLCNYGVPTYLYRFSKNRRSPQKRKRSSPDASPRRPRRAAANTAKRTKIVDDVFSDEDSASDVSSEASDSEDEYDPDKEGKIKDVDDNDESEGSGSEASDVDEDEEESGEEEELDDEEEEEIIPRRKIQTKKPETKVSSITPTRTKSPIKAQTVENDVDDRKGTNAFEKDVIALTELEQKHSSDYGEFKELVEQGGGSVVEDSEENGFKSINVCVVPRSFRDNTTSLASLRKGLPKNVKIVSDTWMTECTLYEKRVDLARYVLS